MFQEIASYLIQIISSLFGAALLLRVWAVAVRLPPKNQFSQAVFQATNWLVRPMRRVIPGKGGIDWASILAAYLTAIVASLLILLLRGASPLSFFPFGLLPALLMTVTWGLNLVMWLTLLLGVLSWINPRSEAMWVLQLLTAPFLNPIRRMLPATSGIDFSPLILIVIVQILLRVLDHLSLMLFGF